MAGAADVAFGVAITYTPKYFQQTVKICRSMQIYIEKEIGYLHMSVYGSVATFLHLSNNECIL